MPKPRKTTPNPDVPLSQRELRSLSMENVYDMGVDVIILPRDTYDTLMDIMSRVEWIPDDDGDYIAIPSWFKDQITRNHYKVAQEQSCNNVELAPVELVTACEQLLQNYSIMGPWMEAFEPRLTLITLWNGAEDLEWHWDGPCQTEFFMLVYLNKQSGWPENGGGELFIGKRPLKSGYMHVIPSEVTPTNKILPMSRTMVCCNNQNPAFVHKVAPLIDADERIVLMIGFNMIPTMKGLNHGQRTDSHI